VTVIKKLSDLVVNGRLGMRRVDMPLLAAAYLLPCLGALHPMMFTVAAVLCAVIIGYFFFSDGLYALYPLVFFFYGQLILPGGIVLYRLYTLLFIARFVYVLTVKRRFKADYPRMALALFMLAVAFRFVISGDIAGGALIDLLFTFCFVVELSQNKNAFMVLLKWFVFAAAVACAVGVFIRSDGDGRFLATLNDPNYLGFYLNIAIFTVFLHPFFRKLYFKLPLLFVLYASLIASRSITGLGCNLVLLLLVGAFLVKKKRLKLKYVGLITVFICITVQIISVSQVKSWGMISSFSGRLIAKLGELISEDIAGFTSSRSALWKINSEKFFSLPAVTQIFGGGPCSAVGRNGILFEQTSHQEFIDVMITAGVVGFFIFTVLVACIVIRDVALLFKSGSDKSEAVLRVGIKLIWLFYALGLTMFLNSRFYIPFLI